jgi:hypothetical protein
MRAPGEWLASHEGPRRTALVADTSAGGAPLVPARDELGPAWGGRTPSPRLLDSKGASLLGMLEAFWEARKPGSFQARRCALHRDPSRFAIDEGAALLGMLAACWVLGAVQTRPLGHPDLPRCRQPGRRAAGRAGGPPGGTQAGRAPGAPAGRGAESRLVAVCRRAPLRPGAPPAGLLRPAPHARSQGPACLLGARRRDGVNPKPWSADRPARARQEGMRLFLQLKAGRTATADDLLRALLARLPLPPANGSSLAVRAAPPSPRARPAGAPCAPRCVRTAARGAVRAAALSDLA